MTSAVTTRSCKRLFQILPQDENEEPKISENEEQEGNNENEERTLPIRRSSRVRNQQKLVVEIDTRTTRRTKRRIGKGKETVVAVLKETGNHPGGGLQAVPSAVHDTTPLVPVTVNSTPKTASRSRCNRTVPSTPTTSSPIIVPAYLTPSTMRLISTANGGPRTPQTPAKGTGTGPTSVYQEAKSLFRRTAAPTCLVGRSAERESIRRFWNDHVVANRAGSLYLSGAPGTGKTALMDEIVRTLLPSLLLQTDRCKVDVRVVNCMAVPDPKGIYAKIFAEISGENLNAKDAVKALANLFCGGDRSKKSPLYVVVLDEIDCLITKDQEVLYKLFEWPTLPDSKLVLIGIANALDLTDRFLPRLRAKNIEPQLLHFNPYQVSEITEIIKDRLRSLENVRTAASNQTNGDDPFTTTPTPPTSNSDAVPLMQTTAIELCARKVAGATGDLRKALDVCRQAIEMVESETRNNSKPNNTSGLLLGSNETGGIGGVVALSSAPKVTVSHVLKVLSSAFGSAGLQKIRSLALQQKQLLAVYLLLSRGRKKEITVASLYDSYVSESGRQKLLAAVSRSEYVDMISCLEASGILTIESKKFNKRRRTVGTSSSSSSTPSGGGAKSFLGGEDQRDRTVTLTVQESDALKAVSETPVLKKFYDQGILFEERNWRSADAAAREGGGGGTGMGMGMIKGH